MSDVISSDTNERRPPTAMSMTATITAARVFTTAMRIHMGPARASSFMAATILRQRSEPRLDLVPGATVHDEPQMGDARQHRDRRLGVGHDRGRVALGMEGFVAVADEHEHGAAHRGEVMGQIAARAVVIDLL